MAGRNPKTNADFFKHDSDMRHDRKILAVRQKFGIAGYGVYCMLLEILADSEDFQIKVDDLELILLAGDIGVESVKLEEILTFFSEVRLMNWDGEKLFCQKLIDRLKPMLEKRERERERYEEAKRKQAQKGKKSISAAEINNPATESDISATEITQSRVEESRVEESRVEESRVEESRVEESVCVAREEKHTHTNFLKDSDFSDDKNQSIIKNKELNQNEETPPKLRGSPPLESAIILPFSSEDFERCWDTWKKYKKSRGHPYENKIEEQAALRQLSEFDESFCIGLIESSMSSGWKGLVYDSTPDKYQKFKNRNDKSNIIELNPKTGKQTGHKPDIAQKMARRYQKYNNRTGQ